MTLTVRRSLARLAGVALTCAGLCLGSGTAVAAAPAGDDAARADDTAGAADRVTDESFGVRRAAVTGAADLAVSVTGTALAATTAGKDANVTIVNRGPGTATGILLAFDLSALDTDKVAFGVPDDDACRTQGDLVSCDVIDLDNGQALDLGVRLTRRAGAVGGSPGGGSPGGGSTVGAGTGSAGTLTATVSHDGVDDDRASDTVTVPVSIIGSGPDLYAYAPDVPFDPWTNQTGAVPPGGTAKLRYAIGNFGDVAVAGVRLVIRLPRRVTFAEAEPGCAYDRDRTRATCTYPRMPIVPADADTDAGDRVYSMVSFYNLVTIAADAPAPGRLGGGEIAVEPLMEGAPDIAGGGRLPTVAVLPVNATGGSARRLATPPDAAGSPQAGVGDVDMTDNVDEFVVYVADTAVPAGPGGAAGGLPITGSRPGRTAGLGLIALAVGAVLLRAGRRRGPAASGQRGAPV